MVFKMQSSVLYYSRSLSNTYGMVVKTNREIVQLIGSLWHVDKLHKYS
jgi:hypothetical protein